MLEISRIKHAQNAFHPGIKIFNYLSCLCDKQNILFFGHPSMYTMSAKNQYKCIPNLSVYCFFDRLIQIIWTWRALIKSYVTLSYPDFEKKKKTKAWNKTKRECWNLWKSRIKGKWLGYWGKIIIHQSFQVRSNCRFMSNGLKPFISRVFQQFNRWRKGYHQRLFWSNKSIVSMLK